MWLVPLGNVLHGVSVHCLPEGLLCSDRLCSNQRPFHWKLSTHNAAVAQHHNALRQSAPFVQNVIEPYQFPQCEFRALHQEGLQTELFMLQPAHSQLVSTKGLTILKTDMKVLSEV